MTVVTITPTQTDSYHDTELDYVASLYYDARTDGFLYQNGSELGGYSLVDNPIADFYLYTPTVIGDSYEGISDHYVRCYYTEVVNSTIVYEDPLGFSVSIP